MKRDYNILFVGFAVVLLLFLFGKKIVVMAIGYRNNNPGNIRMKKDSNGNQILLYAGEIISPDKSFKAFKSIEYGYRAMFALLFHYINSEGLNTIRKIINVYAPPVENDTTNYINIVSEYTGVQPDTKISITDETFMKNLVAAMSSVENVIDPDVTQVNKGYDLYFT